MDFLSNPHQLWDTGRMENRHAVIKLTFADRLSYVRQEKFRTPETTLPFKALSGFAEGGNKMVRLERFELPTNWFEASYSIQLSYRRLGQAKRRQDTNNSRPRRAAIIPVMILKMPTDLQSL